MPEHTIAENLTRLQNAKTAIGNAIIAKGGTVTSGDGLEDFASDIGTIPDNSATIAALIDRSITSIEAPSGVTSIGRNAFTSCYSLSSVTLPDTLVTIKAVAFDACQSLSNIELPNTLVTIENNAFRGCSSLVSIDIPSSVTTIGNSVFAFCTNLTTITVHKPTDSIAGAPWGAPNATVVWTG